MALQLDAALDWAPPAGFKRVRTLDAHTGGEPFRIVVSGAPPIPGDTMLVKRRQALEHVDALRRLLMWEPRGHVDMYGGFLTEAVTPGADFGVLFMHNAGFSTMCGHGIIALTKVVLDTGMLARSGPTEVRIDTPAGPVRAFAEVLGGVAGPVSFRNVPAFVAQLDATVTVKGLGRVHYDLAFGGAYYAVVDAARLGLACTPADTPRLVAAGRAIKSALVASQEITHPLDQDLAFLYGVVFTGPAADPAHHSRNVCVFADGEVDRSPTGTGVSARLAIHHARGEVEMGEEIVVESLLGSRCAGRIVEETHCGSQPAVVPEIRGTATLTGRHEFFLDPDDELAGGFLLR
jgi:trans-L-3-hydroxyproline dehydratase